MMSETADSTENGEDLSHSKMDLKMDKGHNSFLENGKVSQNDSGFEMTQLDNSAEEFNPDLSTNGISLNLSITKNNESGIDIEKSPLSSAKDSAINSEHSPSLKDCSMLSELDLSECVSESLTDSGNASRTNSVCESEKRHLKVADQENSQEKLISNCDTDVNKDTAQSVQDSIKCESSDKEGMSVDQGASSATDVAMANKDSDGDSDIKPVSFKKCLGKKRKYRSRRIASDSEKDSDDDDTDKAEERSTRGQQSRMDDEETESELDSDDFSEEEIDDENMESAKSKSDDQKSESEEEEEDQDRPKPRQTWKAIFDLRNREVGFNNKTPPSIFREKVQGSLQMVQRFKLQYKMEYHDGCVNALSFNRIGTLLASGSDDLNVILWNWIKKRPSLVYDSGHRGNVFQAKFMPFSGDCHVVSCARDGQVRLAELSLTGVCKGTKKLAQHKGAAHKLALEYDSPHVFLSCGEDAMVYEIDLRQEKPNKLCQTKLESRKIPLYSIHSNPSNSYEFCVGGRDRYIRIYDKRKIAQSEDGLLKKFCPHHLVDSKSKADVTCAVYNYNGTEILGSYNDDDIYLFNNLHSDEADFIRRYKGHRNSATVKGVNFYGPRSEFVVSGSDCGHVFLWDKETEDVVQFMEGDECGVINVLEPHPFAPVLATSGLDHDVKIWAPTAEEPSVLPNLKTTAKKNKRERDEENTNEPQALQDMLDGPMLYYIMRQISRARRRNDPEGENSSSNDSSESDSEDSDIAPDRLQCAQQ